MFNHLRTRDIVFLAMLAAIAFTSVLFIRIPIMPAAPFLRYDIKDVIIVIGGFVYGPLAALAVALVVGLLQMLMVSEYGLIGFLMTFLSTVSFVCTASAIYHVKKNQWCAIIGLAVGCVSMTTVMMLWNYIITPLYMDTPRATVASMLIPVFLPFNAIKSILNAAITLCIFKPLIAILRISDPNTDRFSQIDAKSHFSLVVVLVSFFIVISSILLILTLQGVI